MQRWPICPSDDGRVTVAVAADADADAPPAPPPPPAAAKPPRSRGGRRRRRRGGAPAADALSPAAVRARLRGAPFYHQVDYTTWGDPLSAEAPPFPAATYYELPALSLEALLPLATDPAFRGLCAMPARVPADRCPSSGGAWSLAPDRTLTLEVGAELYATLGVPCRRAPCGGGGDDGLERYVAAVDLGAPEMKPGTPAFERLRWCLSRQRVPPLDAVACADGGAALDFAARGIAARAVAVQVDAWGLDDATVPAALGLEGGGDSGGGDGGGDADADSNSGDDSASDDASHSDASDDSDSDSDAPAPETSLASGMYEWLGAAACRLEPLLLGRDTADGGALVPTRPLLDGLPSGRAKLRAYRWRGFLPPSFALAAVEAARAHSAGTGGAAASLWRFPDAPSPGPAGAPGAEAYVRAGEQFVRLSG